MLHDSWCCLEYGGWSWLEEGGCRMGLVMLGIGGENVVSCICLDCMQTVGSGSDPDVWFRSSSSLDIVLNLLRAALNRDHCM